jgi:multiple sugar transport system ATP-binding protein
MAGVSVSEIHKSFGSVEVLKGISLDIQDGEFMTLVGPSGCGKSTLLRVIAGLERQDSGDVLIDGAVVDHLRPSRRDLSMVFQSYALYPHLSVRDNIAVPLRMRRLHAFQRLPLIGRLAPGRGAIDRKIQEDVRSAAETLNIGHLLDRKPGQLSGGQKQRVAVGRAMVRQPAAFLMDEPLSNLDAKLRVQMRAEFAQLHRSLGATFIYVTHDQAEAMTMSDRIAVMMEGDILQIGSPNEVYQNPRDLRVAEFVGSPKINVLSGEGDGSGRVSCLGVALARRLETPADGGISIGLRPEHLELRPRNSSGCFVGRLSHKENLGPDIFLHIVLNDGADLIVVRTTPFEAQDAAIGDELWIGRDAGRAMAFGADGRRLPLIGKQTSERVA